MHFTSVLWTNLWSGLFLQDFLFQPSLCWFMFRYQFPHSFYSISVMIKVLNTNFGRKFHPIQAGPFALVCISSSKNSLYPLNTAIGSYWGKNGRCHPSNSKETPYSPRGLNWKKISKKKLRGKMDIDTPQNCRVSPIHPQGSHCEETSKKLTLAARRCWR